MVDQGKIFPKEVFGMKRKEEIELAWFRKEVQSNHRYDEKTFKEAVEWADASIIERLRELKNGFEKNLDAVPRSYERDIRLCAKISLLDRIITELEEE